MALPGWLVMLVFTFIEAWSLRRDARIQFLQVQVELLRQRVPGNRVILTPEERSRLLRLGASLKHQIDDLIGIVSVKTYKRWLREQQGSKKPGRVGRPRKITASLRELILRLARENVGWGVRRIVGELRKLALTPSRSSVRRVLIDEGLLPDPNRRAPKGVTTPWRTFVAAHLECMVATDFFCKKVWTPLGVRFAYVLVFIHLGTRKVMISQATYEPRAPWVEQQGRNCLMWVQEQGFEIKHLVRDNDAKFTAHFDRIFKTSDASIVSTPIQAPIANCYAESWIGKFKRECLNHMICVSLGQLDFITRTYEKFHNTHRPHQGLSNRTLDASDEEIVEQPLEDTSCIRRVEFLGGLLNHYERKAA